MHQDIGEQHVVRGNPAAAGNLNLAILEHEVRPCFSGQSGEQNRTENTFDTAESERMNAESSTLINAVDAARVERRRVDVLLCFIQIQLLAINRAEN